MEIYIVSIVNTMSGNEVKVENNAFVSEKDAEAYFINAMDKNIQAIENAAESGDAFWDWEQTNDKEYISYNTDDDAEKTFITITETTL